MIHHYNFPVEHGKFAVGLNYWASHAGTDMWTKWDASVVEADFLKIQKAGVSILRVFPLWPIFQPLTGHYAKEDIYEYRLGEEPLADDFTGRCGLDKTQLDHFRILLDLAMKYRIQILPALITGHMSGRLYVPPALEGKNVYTNADSLRWQVRFVRGFIAAMKDHAAITAWDLGNECENMLSAPLREEASVWLTLITNAIRLADGTRPIVSGFANLGIDNTERGWFIQDHAEEVDTLTNHGYHIFESCIDPIDSFRSILRPVAETVLYRDIGKRPCFLEEVGAIGYMNTSEETEACYYRALLFSLWAHDCRGSFWWCAFDQGHLTQTPYDWNCIGSDYGYFRANGSEKPVARESRLFLKTIANLPFDALPPRITDGVCILPKGYAQSAPSIATNTMALAMQCGLDLEFCSADSPLPASPLYLLPSIKGQRYITKHRFEELLTKVAEGAVLYLSADDCLLRRFPELTGLTPSSREPYHGEETVTISGIYLQVKAPYRYTYESVESEVLAVSADNTPVYVCQRYGKGKIFFTTIPIEGYLMKKIGAFHYEGASPYYEFYKAFQKEIPTLKVVSSNNPNTPITEHILSEQQRVAVIMNYGAKEQSTQISLRETWLIDNALYGSAKGSVITIGKQDAAVLLLRKGESI